MDVLSDVLRTLRLEGAFFLRGELSEPWCVEVPAGAQLSERLFGRSVDVAVVHLVTRGSCWIRGTDGDTAHLGEGDVAVLPYGDAHRLGAPPFDDAACREHLVVPEVPHLGGLTYGGNGAATELACGWFAMDRDTPNPLLDALPRQFVGNLSKRAAGPWLVESVRFALSGAARGRAGSDVLSSKVAEALFVEALVDHVESLPTDHRGWLAGLRDPLVARCLAVLHRQPNSDLTLDDLAHAVHASRSVVARRFQETVGVPPMRYLTEWRLGLATRALRDPRVSVGEAAGLAGYASEAAFCRAFRRHFGDSPGAWRRAGPRASGTVRATHGA